MTELTHHPEPGAAHDGAADQLLDEASQAAYRFIDGSADQHLPTETVTPTNMQPPVAEEIIRTNPNVLNKKEWHDAVVPAVEKAIAEGKPVSVIFLDLDFFKFLNDQLGHTRGDETIEGIKGLVGNVTDEVRTQVKPDDPREPDLVSLSDDQPARPIAVENELIDPIGGHIGGDEFGIFCHADAAGAQKIVERLLVHFDEYLGRPENQDMKETGVGMSVGVATSDETTTGAGDLLRKADHAMYEDKIDRLRPLEPMERQLFDKALELLTEARVRPRDIDKYMKKEALRGRDTEPV